MIKIYWYQVDIVLLASQSEFLRERGKDRNPLYGVFNVYIFKYVIKTWDKL